MLEAKLDADIKQALLGGDKPRAEVLRGQPDHQWQDDQERNVEVERDSREAKGQAEGFAEHE